MRPTLLFGALALAGSASAQLSPNIGGEISGLNTVLRNSARTYQAFYGASTFSNTGAVNLTGIQFRLSAEGNETVPSTWPSQPLNFNDYTIELAHASAAFLSDGEYLSSTTSFDYARAAGTNVVVRSGALSLSTASFAQDGGGGPNSFGASIQFDTPFLLNPGDNLVLTIRHTGYAPSSEVQPFFAAGTYIPGVTDAISSTAGANASVSGGFSDPMIAQFSTQAVPEPASLLVLGAGALIAARRRRK